MTEVIKEFFRAVANYFGSIRSRPPFSKQAQARIDEAEADVEVAKLERKEELKNDLLEAEKLGISPALYRRIEKRAKQLEMTPKEYWLNSKKRHRRIKRYNKKLNK